MNRISLDVAKEAVALGILEVSKVSSSDIPSDSAYGFEKLLDSDLVAVYPLPYQESLRHMLFVTTGLFVAVTMDRRISRLQKIESRRQRGSKKACVYKVEDKQVICKKEGFN